MSLTPSMSPCAYRMPLTTDWILASNFKLSGSMPNFHGRLQAYGLASSDEDDDDSGNEHAQQDDLAPPSDDSDSEYTEGSPQDAQSESPPASESKEPEPDDVHGEEDGHQNAEGVDYREPRSTALIGTRWNGIKNAYIRIGICSTDRPRGSRPLGYIWVPSINGYRRVLSQALADEERPNLQAKNRQRPAGERLETLLGDDVPNCSLLEISFYVSAMGHSVPICWFELPSRAWRIAVDQSGAGSQVMMAYERGNRKELGHLQGVARLKTHEQLLDKIRRWMQVALLLAAGQFKCKIGLAFFTGRTWEFMGGYVQKDMGKPHCLFFMYPPIGDGASFVFLTRAHRT